MGTMRVVSSGPHDGALRKHRTNDRRKLGLECRAHAALSSVSVGCMRAL